MQTELLHFIPGTELAEDGGRVGVTLLGKTQWTRDAVQADIVRQVLQTPRSPETYAAQLAIAQNLPPGSAEATLHVLTFILDFKDFLQSR